MMIPRPLALTLAAVVSTACASPAPAPAPAPVARAAVDFARIPAKHVATSPDAEAIVAAGDRTDADRALDAGRRPAEMLTWLGVKPGMKVGEILAGTGNTSELLARAVGPSGVVYAQNNAWLLQKFAAAPWAERLKRDAMKNVVRADRENEEPFPPEAKGLDVVVISLVYHDTVWMKTDRAKMNAAVFAALKSGGVYAVIDHSAVPGHGLDDVMTLHRIDEDSVKKEVLAAGFTLAEEADFLRNPEDDRDWNDSPKAAAERRGTSDRFALKFAKP